MEKRLLLFMFLSFALLWFWFGMFGKKEPPKEDEKPGEGAPAVPGTEPGTGTGTGEPPAEAPPPGEAGDLSRVDDSHEGIRKRHVMGPRTKWTLSTWGGTVEAAHLKEFAREPGQDLAKEESWYPALCRRGEDPNRAWFPRRRALALVLVSGDGKPADRPLLRLDEVLWEDVTPEGSDFVLYRKVLPEAGLTVEKEFRFPKVVDEVPGEPYHMDFGLRVKVDDPEKAQRYGKKLVEEGEESLKLRFRLIAAGGIPAEPFQTGSPVVGSALRVDTVSVEEFDSAARPWPRSEKKEDWAEIEVWPGDDDDRGIAWVGLHNRFFGAILEPMQPRELGRSRAVFFPISEWMLTGREEEYANWAAALEFDLEFDLGQTAPGPAEEKRSFLFFVGPIDPDVLSTPAYEKLKPIIDYGLFGFISKAIVFLLGLIQSVVANWGVAIIILTLVIRMAMFPLSRKSQLAMQGYQRQMAKLKPKMDEIKKRYAKNRKKMNEEVMKLYREEGVRVFPAGCLIMFLQLPIFIGLFQALRYTVGLRHSAFLWAPDLTAPDRLAGPVSTGSIPLVPDPLYLNVFPILMGVTWYLSTALAPKPSDPQQASTMKMMKWMPIIFSLLLYNYPAGLALYMVVSSTWSIFETKVVKKVFMKEDKAAVVAGPRFRKGR
jgi:YidC/Oxa1 family membrane protein insertase